MTAGTSAVLGCQQMLMIKTTFLVKLSMWPLACHGQMTIQKPDPYKPPPTSLWLC